MSFLTRANLIKAFAALLILGFVIELFIVYTYSPSQQAPVDDSSAVSQSSVREEVVSLSLAPFVIRSFTDAVEFQCNATRLDALPGLLGAPVALGASGNSTLFLARVNGSIPDAGFIAGLKELLRSSCGSVVVYRQASVSFNGTIVDVASVVSQNRSNLTKRHFESYADRFGRGSQALISDANAVVGDVVELRIGAVLVGGSIVPDSLVLEQSSVPSQRVVTLQLVGVVSSFRDSGFAVLQLPWENRSIELAFFGGAVISEETRSVDEILIANASGVNESFLKSVEFVSSVENRNGKVVLHVDGNFADRQAAVQALSSINGTVEFPVSRYIVEFNSTLWQQVAMPFETVFLKQAVLNPSNETVEGLTLPSEFSAVVYSNASVGDSVLISSQALLEDGQVVGLIGRQTGVELILGN